MTAYLIRRVFYGALILIGVNLLTFFLFFVVNSPDDMARLAIGGKYVSEESIENWKSAHGYDKALFFNGTAPGAQKFTQTVFFQKSVPLLKGDFGMSDAGRSINQEISERLWPSLALAVPTFILGTIASILYALFLTLVRRTKFEWAGVVASIAIMSVSSLFYIIFGQWLFSKTLRLVPVSGYMDGLHAAVFLILPVLIGVFTKLGGEALLFRAVLLEELPKDYVRTARAKGAGEARVLFCHVLKNAAVPILTMTLAGVPSLFLGSLVMESFFGIPGLGSYTIDAINAQDFSIVRSMVFLGTVAYIAGLILTDIAYCAADPRIRFR